MPMYLLGFTRLRAWAEVELSIGLILEKPIVEGFAK